MAGAGVRLSGFKELDRALSKLPEELAKTAEAAALREGMKPVKREVTARAPTGKGKEAGLLKRSIGLNVRKNKRGSAEKGRYTARVGPRTGFKIAVGTAIAKVTKGKRRKGQPYTVYKDPTKYAHLVELGTSHSAADPFIRSGTAAAEPEVLNGLVRGYEKGLSKAVDKLRKK